MDRSIHLSFHLSIINTIYDVIQNYILHHIADKIASISFVSQLFAFTYRKGENSIILGHDTEFLNIFIDEKLVSTSNRKSIFLQANLHISRKI